MPRVRTLQRQVEQAPLPQVRQSQIPIGQVPTPQIDFRPQPVASQFGEALQQLGGAIIEDQLRIREEEKRKQDEVRVLEADRKLSEWENVYLYDPKNGAMNREGKDAFGLPDEAIQSFDKTYKDLSATLANDRQRELFMRQAHTRRQDLHTSVMRKASAEIQKFDDAETENYLANAQQAALANATDPVRVQTEIERQRIAIAQYADRHGLGAEYIKQKTAAAVSDTHVGVIDGLLAQGLDLQARAYATEHRQEISGNDIAKVDRALQVNTRNGESLRAADAIRQQHPFGAADVTLQTWLDEAAKIKDPEVRKDTEDRLRTYYSAFRQDAADRQAAQVAQFREMVDEFVRDAENRLDAGLAIDEIQRRPGWFELPDNARKDLLAYAKAIAKGTGEIETNWDVYVSLKNLASNPASQQEFAKMDLLRFRGQLADTEFKEIESLKAAILKGDGKNTDALLSDFRTEKQVVDATLEAAGIATSPKPGPEAARYAELMRQLGQRVVALQQRTGKKATNEDVQKELDQLLMQVVTQPGSWWNILPGGAPFSDQRKRFFEVTVADIPKAELPHIDDLLRAGGFPINDDNRLRLYLEKVKAEQGGK